MAKKRASRESKPSTAKRKKWSSQRGRTIKSSGSVPETLPVAPEVAEKVNVGEAMRRAIEKLGDIKVDDDLAPTQLRELGDCFEEITRRQAAYDARAEEAKTAKKSLESAQEMLLERVKAFTHPAPLPLFDNTEREADLEAMTGAGELQAGEPEEVTVHA